MEVVSEDLNRRTLTLTHYGKYDVQFERTQAVHPSPRKSVSSIFFIILAIFSAGCANDSPRAKISFSDLPGIHTGHYEADTYIQTAVALQSLGRSAALERLYFMARSKGADARVTLLCPMLFAKRLGSDFRGPMLGAASFLGGTDYSDWPLEPIALVEGLPFLTTRGYALAGQAEENESYLHYCETNCDRSAFRYSTKTKQQQRSALSALMALPKWKKPLDESEKAFLEGQTQ